MQKIVEKTEQNCKILQLIPADVMQAVPPEKKEEFQWGVITFLKREKETLYQEFAQPQAVSEEIRRQLEETIRGFADMVRARHKKAIEKRG